ncbi:hypothetical protein LG202_13590 [Methylobacillus methanolivorans]
MKHFLLGLLLAGTCLSASGREFHICDSKVDGTSICVLQSQFAEYINKNSPTSRGNVLILTATAIDNVVLINGVIQSPTQELLKEFKVKSKKELFAAATSAMSRNTSNKEICTLGSSSRSLIEAGGEMIYNFKLADGTPFALLLVNRC